MLKNVIILLCLLCFFQSFAQEARVYKENEKWGLLGAEKKRVTPAIYDQIIPGTPYSVVKKYEAASARFKVGCINESGDVVIPLAYTDLRVEGLRIIACIKNPTGFAYGVLSLKNEVIIPLQYKSVKALGTLRFAVENPEGKFALFTEEGQILTDFSIDAISPYRQGYSIFEQNGLVGLLDREGVIKVEARYRNINIQNDGTILAEKPASWQWMNTKKEIIQSLEADSVTLVSSELLMIKNRKGFALVTKELKSVSEYYSKIASSQKSGLYLVKKQKYGVMDMAGKLLLPCQFDSVYIGQHFIYTRQDNKWNIVSHLGKLLSIRGYESIKETNTSTFVKKNTYWGVLNEAGKEMVACVYDSILESNGQQLAVAFKGKFGIISRQEQWLVAPQAHPLQLVNETHYLQQEGNLLTLKDFQNHTLYFTNNKLIPAEEGFIETTSFGEKWHVSFQGIVTKLQQKPLEQFNTLEEEHEGYRAIQRDGKWGFVDELGRLRIPNRYDVVKHFSEGLAPFSLRKKWGFINKEDEIIIHPTYEEAQPFEKGFSIIKQKGLYGLLNRNNEIVLPCRFESVSRLPSGFFELKNSSVYGLADGNGKIIYEPKYHAQDILQHHIIVQRNGKYGVLSMEGFDVIPTAYDFLQATNNTDVFLISTKGSIDRLIF